jgi:predicted membrane metal-binding protein
MIPLVMVNHDLFFCIVVEARTGLSFVAIPLTQALALLLVLLCVVACVVARPCYLQLIVEDIFILSKKSHYIY